MRTVPRLSRPIILDVIIPREFLKTDHWESDIYRRDQWHGQRFRNYRARYMYMYLHKDTEYEYININQQSAKVKRQSICMLFFFFFFWPDPHSSRMVHHGNCTAFTKGENVKRKQGGIKIYKLAMTTTYVCEHVANATLYTSDTFASYTKFTMRRR